MISLPLGIKLKSAGLVWLPEINDFFGIPERDLDDQIFVLSDLMSFPASRFGKPVITFHGAAEWALDYMVTTDVVWLPREDQLRKMLEARLLAEGENPTMTLTLTPFGARCEFVYHGTAQTFSGDDAGEVYGQALLFILGGEK